MTGVPKSSKHRVTVLFAGGGSVGHIAPSVAVAEEIASRHADWKLYFVCGDKPEEATFLQRHGFSCGVLSPVRKNTTLLWKLPLALFASWKIIEKRRVDLLFSTGGFIGLPLCLVAVLKCVPIILFEADAVPGLGNRIVGRWAKRVCRGFPFSVKGMKTIFTGMPVRAELLQGSKEEGRRLTGFRGSKPVLLVLGGSQGAQTINELLMAHLPSLLPLADIVHITGAGKHMAGDKDGYWSREFVVEELPHLYAIADLALTRAGSNVLHELAASGIPSVVLPLKGVAHDHQYHNAYAMCRDGGCVVAQDQGREDAMKNVIELLKNPERRKMMSEKIHKLAFPDAACAIARIIVSNLDRKLR